MSEATTETKAAKPPKPAERKICLCTGQETNGKSRFVAGLDARMKGYLQRIHRGTPRDGDATLETLIGFWNDRYAEFPDRQLAADATVRQLTEVVNEKWLKFLTDAPVRKPRRKIITRKVGRWNKEGHTEGRGDDRVFVFTDSKDNERKVPWDQTSDPEEPEAAEPAEPAEPEEEAAA